MTTTYIRRTDGRRPPRTGGFDRGNTGSSYGSSRPSSGGRGGYSDRGGRSSFSNSRPKKRGFEEMSVDLSKLINKAKPMADEAPFVPVHQFTDFAIDARLKDNIIKKGYLLPTPIQDQSIPHVLDGEDIVGMANTGTGKTAAFLIPLIDKVLKFRELGKNERVLIMVPTRELALQIEQEFYGFAKFLNINAVCCVGGANIMAQVRVLRRSPNFVIGTPGRLKDLAERGELDFTSFSTVVLDEADRMLDMGFISDMRFVLGQMPSPRHTLFFSATLSRDIEKLIGEFLNKPARVSVKTRDTAATIDQDVVYVKPGESKLDLLVEMLKDESFQRVIVFGRTKHGVERLTNDHMRAGVKAESIHGDKTHGRRQKALGLFKQGHVRVLVATDVAARGLDITGVSHVINFDLPATYEDYTHRIGRTGRAGTSGKALTFVNSR
jgi:ATP-dependent RNA helicase RhlE